MPEHPSRGRPADSCKPRNGTTSGGPSRLTYRLDATRRHRWMTARTKLAPVAIRVPGTIQLVPIRALGWVGTVWFARAHQRFFCHVEEGEDFRGGALSSAAQGNPKADLLACSCPHRQVPRVHKAPFLEGN